MFLRLSSLLFLALSRDLRTFGAVVSNTRRPTQDITISSASISPDGFTRPAILVDGKMPGPTIRGRKGQTMRINVHNQLNDTSMLRSTSIHWHGIHQVDTNFNDGAAWVTQCPIASNASYIYSFTPQQGGTSWAHSHLSTQYCDGLRFPLVIDDPEDPHASLYDVDNGKSISVFSTPAWITITVTLDSTILSLTDWYHSVSPQVPRVTPPIWDSNLINGLGRWSGAPNAPLPVIEVETGKRYRFRVFNMACEASYNLTIDAHKFTVIEADTENTEPHVVDSLEIFAGQRYSIVVEANQPVTNYWLRAAPKGIGRSLGFENNQNSAIFRYKGAPVADPEVRTPAQTSVLPLRESGLRPLGDLPAPGKPGPGQADISLNFNMGFDTSSSLFTLNGKSFIPPTVPVLLQILSGASAARDLLPQGLVQPLPLGKVVEISIPATDATNGREAPGGAHPFHLHGHSFAVVRSAGSDYNYLNPVRRDVVSMGSGSDNVTIRFETDNAGPWILHCHIDWHQDNGLSVVMAEGTKATRNRDTPADWAGLCPSFNELRIDQL